MWQIEDSNDLLKQLGNKVEEFESFLALDENNNICDTAQLLSFKA